MDKYFFETAAGTKYHVCLNAVKCGSDLNACICGGTLHHIGAVSMAVYEPVRGSATVSTLCVHTHRDDALSSKLAKLLSAKLRCTVSLSVGIHIDDAQLSELEIFQSNASKCCEMLIKAISP